MPAYISCSPEFSAMAYSISSSPDFSFLRLRTIQKIRVSPFRIISLVSRFNHHLRTQIRAVRKEGTDVEDRGSPLFIEEVGGYELNGNGAPSSHVPLNIGSVSNDFVGRDPTPSSSVILGENGSCEGTLVKYGYGNVNGVSTGKAEVVLERESEGTCRKKQIIEEIPQEEAWFNRAAQTNAEVSVAAGGRWNIFITYSSLQRILEIWGYVMSFIFKAWINNKGFSYRGKIVNPIFSWKRFLPKEPNSKHDEHIMNNSVKRRILVSLAPLIFFPTSSSIAITKSTNPYNEKRLLERNRRLQKDNNVPEDFPNFIREGFQVKVIASDKYIKCDSGLIYTDIDIGNGVFPTPGQQVTFHYIGYNEAGRRIDSTYSQGKPAHFRMGSSGLVPGFEEGIRNMRVGGKRRLIIPPELGPPVGPSTFFSSKQFEVFDVEVLSVQNCERRTIGFYSDLVCS